MKALRQGGLLIAKIHQLSGRIFAKILKRHRLTEINPAQGRILFVLWDRDAIPISELSRKTRLEKSTLTAMLDRLEHDGLIQRAASTEDRRKIIISSTKKNSTFQSTYFRVSEEMLGIFYKGFTAAEIDTCENLLARILSNLEEYR